MTETTKATMTYLIDHVMKNATTNRLVELTEKWAQRLDYCMNHMGEEEYGRHFLHNIAVYMGLDHTYREIDDSVVQLTLVQLLQEVSPIIGLPDHPIFALPNAKSRETVLPGGKWLLRKKHSKVCKYKKSFAVYVSNDESDSSKTISRRLAECNRVIEEAKS